MISVMPRLVSLLVSSGESLPTVARGGDYPKPSTGDWASKAHQCSRALKVIPACLRYIIYSSLFKVFAYNDPTGQKVWQGWTGTENWPWNFGPDTTYDHKHNQSFHTLKYVYQPLFLKTTDAM